MRGLKSLIARQTPAQPPLATQTQRGGSGDDRAGLELLQSIWAIHGA